MAEKFYAKGPGNEGYIKNMEVVGYHDLHEDNIFQMALYRTPDQRYYLYCAGFGCLGVTIVEVTDPAAPRYVKRMMPVDPAEYPASRDSKIQIADDLMIINMSTGGGPKVEGENRKKAVKAQNGVRIYSLREDPENPRFLSYWDTGVPGGSGVHRFCYNGGRYVHLSADCAGYEGMIYRILDIIDPEHPVEVGRWWLPEQFIDGYVGREYDPSAPHTPEFMDKGHLHGPPYVLDGKAYCGYSGGGLCIVDIEDVRRPKLIGQLLLHPPFSGGLAGSRCHTALPVRGRDLVVVTNEGERFGWFNKEKINNRAQPMNNLHMVDVRDLSNPTLIAEFPYPQVPEGFPYKNFNEMGLGVQGPFGPHNIHEPMDGKPWLDQDTDKIYCCYFSAGLRVFDISDQYYIKELAYFIPPNPVEHRFPHYIGPVLATTEDVIVDDRGYIYIDCLEDGIYILRLTGDAAETNT